MSKFIHYRRKSISEMRPFVAGEKLDKKVSISEADLDNGSPKVGDMIARNPDNHEDQWLVAKDYFEKNLEKIERNVTVNKKPGTSYEFPRIKGEPAFPGASSDNPRRAGLTKEEYIKIEFAKVFAVNNDPVITAKKATAYAKELIKKISKDER